MHNVSENSSVYKIPIRATLLSALLFIPHALILSAIYASNLEKDKVGHGVRMVVLILNAIRCPAIGK